MPTAAAPPQALKSQLGADAQTTENVSVANQADLYRQYAAKGYNVVIGWGGQFTDGAVQVAQEFPNVKFIVVNSGVENGKNLASIDTDIQDWEFLGGFVTAKLSKTGVIGWVGGQCFPATAANLHGVEQGAKYANANIKVLSTFTGDFEDPTKAQQAAQAMIDSGKAGALTGNLNNGWFGVLKAARDNGKIPVVTEWIDNRAAGSRRDRVVDPEVASQVRRRRRQGDPCRQVPGQALPVRNYAGLGAGHDQNGPAARATFQRGDGASGENHLRRNKAEEHRRLPEVIDTFSTLGKC